MNIMGKRIHDKRVEAGLTLEELGSKLGVNKSAVHKWEKGEVENIKRSAIAQMASIFDCDPVWLMGFEDAPSVTVTYESDGKDPLKASVDIEPIIGKSAAMAKRMALYQAALDVRPESIDIAIKLLKSLS